MRSIRAAFLRLRGTVSGDNPDRDLAAELDSHLELHIDDNVRAGMSPAAARRAALLRLGGLDQTKERYRDRRSLPALDTLARDVREAWRSLRRAPRVTAAIVVMLACALGLNAASFALADALILRPFSFPLVDDIVLIEETRPDRRFFGFTAPANLLDFKREARTLAFLSPVTLRDVELGNAEEPEQLPAALVAAEFFDVIGTRPVLGRSFLSDEETYGRHHRVVIADSLWQRVFSSDPDVIEKTIVLDGATHQIVGVAPPDFNFPFGAQMWVPAAFESEALNRRDNRAVLGLGRLVEGASVRAAESELGQLMHDLSRRYPEALGKSGVRVRTLTDGLAEEGSAALHVFIQGLSLVVLIIACANIANLVLALGVARQREIAVRFALGASRWQILRGLWIESIALALVAIPCALAIAHLGLTVMVSRMPPRIAPFISGWNTIDVDARLVVFTTILAVAATAAFGLFPALRCSRPNADALKEAARGLTGSRERQRVRRALIIAQVALALPLLVSAMGFASGTRRFLNGPQGYDPHGVLRLRLSLPERVYADDRARTAFLQAVLDEISTAASVQSAAAVNILPSTSMFYSRTVVVEGQFSAAPQELVEHRVVSSRYFDTMRIAMLKGRGFNTADRHDTPAVGIASRSMAERYWPGQDPVGRRVRYGDEPDGGWVTVVGVADNLIEDWFWGRDQATFYRPLPQAPPREAALAVRTIGEPGDAAAAVSRAIHRVDPQRPILDVSTMEQTLADRLNAPRNVSAVLATLGGLALVLALIGLYSVINYLVSQRTHEIGLRLALGATPRQIRRLVLGETSRLTALGIVIGSVLAAAVIRLTQGLLAGIAVTDPPILITLIIGVAVVSFASGFWPACRAAGIEPSIALRQE